MDLRAFAWDYDISSKASDKRIFHRLGIADTVLVLDNGFVTQAGFIVSTFNPKFQCFGFFGLFFLNV